MDYASRDRFLPCLLERLKGGRDAEETNVSMSMAEYRKSVIIDLARLLNARSQPSSHAFEEFKALNANPGAKFYHYPEVANSVLNYGFSDLAGTTRSHLDLAHLRKRLVEVIKMFEPRILRDTLKVNFISSDNDDPNSLVRVEIEGKLWARPIPEELLRKGELDLINGEFRLEI
jgi:type VI secretion system protein ImpF